jgi:hypothetical protein
LKRAKQLSGSELTTTGVIMQVTYF